jgi:hypothetical protein
MSQISYSQPASGVAMGKDTFSISGRLFKTLKLRDEGYEFVDHPNQVLELLRELRIKADLFSFTQRLSEPIVRYHYYSEVDSLAVLSISTYEHWWKKQINDKTRNMVRKAEKKGVVLRMVEFSDELVAGIQSIHDEQPIRQGKPFKHYGKPFEIVKRDHSSFLDRSDFIGAYFEGELIGIVKLVHQGVWSNLMQIISKIAHREKAPTNALIAKAVQVCAERGISQLQYGQWSSRGIGDFKLHHGFERREVPRYFIPLNGKGRLMLRFGLHRSLLDAFPPHMVDFLMDMRTKWYHFKFRDHRFKGAVAQLAEHRAKA